MNIYEVILRSAVASVLVLATACVSRPATTDPSSTDHANAESTHPDFRWTLAPAYEQQLRRGFESVRLGMPADEIERILAPPDGKSFFAPKDRSGPRKKMMVYAFAKVELSRYNIFDQNVHIFFSDNDRAEKFVSNVPGLVVPTE